MLLWVTLQDITFEGNDVRTYVKGFSAQSTLNPTPNIDGWSTAFCERHSTVGVDVLLA